MPRINYQELEALAATHAVKLTRDRDEDGPCVHVHECFAANRDAFLTAVDERWPGRYHREYTGSMTVWLRLM